MVTEGAQRCQASAGYKNPRRTRERAEKAQSAQSSQVISGAGLGDFRKLWFASEQVYRE